MAQYIDKSALVAGIKRRLCLLSPKMTFHQQRVELEKLLSFIDALEVIEIGVDLGDPKGDKSAEYIIDTKTLEVKEVGLDTEIMKYQREIYDRDTTVRDVAKYFFELGLKAQKGEKI